MNLVRARRHGIGQLDPSSGIMADIGIGPEDTAPVFDDPSITYGAGSGAPPISYTPAVPQPPSSGNQYLKFGPISPAAAATLNYPTTSTLPAGSISPAPRVAAPGFSLSSLFPSTGMPSWLWLLAAGVGILLIAAPGGGRRR